MPNFTYSVMAFFVAGIGFTVIAMDVVAVVWDVGSVGVARLMSILREGHYLFRYLLYLLKLSIGGRAIG